MSSGIWTPPSGKALTLQAGATYQAVYPTNYTSIQSSQSVATNYLKSNLLRTEILPASSETIDFTFKHVNTKLTLIFKPAEGGPAFSGDFSIQVQAPGLLTGGSVQEIVTLYRPDTNNYTWHGIVYPKGTSTDITVNVTYKNVTYKTTLSGCTLTAGSGHRSPVLPGWLFLLLLPADGLFLSLVLRTYKRTTGAARVTYKNVTYKTTLSGCTLTAGSQYEYTLTIQNNILVPVGSEIKKRSRIGLVFGSNGDTISSAGQPFRSASGVTILINRSTTTCGCPRIDIDLVVCNEGPFHPAFAGNGFRNKSYIYRYYPC